MFNWCCLSLNNAAELTFSQISTYTFVVNLIFFNSIAISKRLRVNEKINASKVRLIDDKGEQLGVKTLEEALSLAREKSLDLAEVAPNADPPVCKIIDYGKYQYHQKKVEQKHRKQQKQTEVKGVRIGFRTNEHDIEVKARMATRFLKARNMVKVTLVFKGREAQHSDLAVEKLLHFADVLKEIATVEARPKRQGNTLFMLLAPIK